MKFCLWVFWVQIGGFVLLLDFVSPPRRKMKAPAEVADRIELKIRERREMVRKDIILGYILLQRYIILMSRIGK